MNIYRKTIERITIIGDMDKVHEAFDYCQANGYRVIRSGPKPIAKYRYDVNKFKIVAEREIFPDN